MAAYPKRRIGNDLVSASGLGCMSMAIEYPSRPLNDEESLQVLTAAADMGVSFWDTSDAYGNNEQLIGRWFKETGRRDEIFLATKFGIRREDGKMTVNGSPEYVKEACAASLERLGTDCIDLYYQHRVDSTVPIEKTVQAMAELKAEGKIRYLGLSECSATTLRRACKVHPIAAAQMEFSPFALEIESPETDFLRTAREVGVKIVVYAPLGKGFLTGAIRSRADMDPQDVRFMMHPRFSDENFDGNLKLVDGFDALAKKKGCTIGQLAIAWVMAQGEGEYQCSSSAKPCAYDSFVTDFIPIPGTKTLKYMKENAGAALVNFTAEDEREVRSMLERVGGAKGARYPAAVLAGCFGDSPELEDE